MRALSRLRFRTTSTRLRSLRRTAVQEGKNEDATAQNQRLSRTRFPAGSDDHTLRRPHLIIQEVLPDRCREIPMQHLRRFRKPGSGTMLRGPLDPPCPPNSLCSSCSSTQRQRSLRDTDAVARRKGATTTDVHVTAQRIVGQACGSRTACTANCPDGVLGDQPPAAARPRSDFPQGDFRFATAETESVSEW